MRNNKTRLRQRNAAAILILTIVAALSFKLAAFYCVNGLVITSAVTAMPEGAMKVLQDYYYDIISPKSSDAPLIEQEHSLPPQPKPIDETSSQNHKPSEPDDEQQPNPKEPPDPVELDIPAQFKGKVLQEDLGGYVGGNYYTKGNVYLKNYTKYDKSDLDKILGKEKNFKQTDLSKPLVFIYHTHATESYHPFDSKVYDKRYNWRSTDNNNNMVAVGAVMCKALEDNGIKVIHDTTQHDYPSYDGSYKNSFDAITKVLKENPSIKIVLDVHRDAIERKDAVIVKPTVVIDGEKYAQVMVISNCDDGSGLIPNWRENLKLAYALTSKIEQTAPTVTRPILFSHRKYNQQLSTGSLLLEIGSHANTLDEAKRTGAKVGEALAKLLLGET